MSMLHLHLGSLHMVLQLHIWLLNPSGMKAQAWLQTAFMFLPGQPGIILGVS